MSTLSGDGPTHGHKDATASTPLSVTGGGPLAVPGGKKISSEAAVVDLEGTSAEALQDEIDDLADRLAQVERVTSMLTPGYTAGLQRQLQASFSTIGERMVDIDTTLLTDAQKRAVAAAVVIQSGARMMSARMRFKEAQSCIKSWRSRELAEVAAPIVAWLRQRETIDESIGNLHKGWDRRISSNTLSEWRRLAVEGRPMRQELDAELHSRRHYRFALCRKVFCGWQRVAHHAQLSEVRWVDRGGRRVALRKEVANSMELHLTAWRRWTYVSREARRRYGDLAKQQAARVFGAFRDECRKRRRLRRLAVTRWMDHGKAYFHIPFRAWYLYMVDSKILNKVRAMLIGSFQRRLERRFLAQILTSWHEFTVHKTSETRSRSQLRASLFAQEALTAAAEEALDEYAKVLVEAEHSLEQEAKTQSRLAMQAEEARGELAALRLKCHTAQQECLRLRTVVRHYELRYPRAFEQSALARQQQQQQQGEDGVGRGGGGGEAVAAEEPMPAAGEDDDEQSGGLRSASEVVAVPEAPLIVSRSEAARMQRLSLASGTLLGKEGKYTPPESGGTQADAELRRMRVLMQYVLSGEMPDKPSLELMNIDQAAMLQLGIREAAGAAQVYSTDGESLRPINLPRHLAPEGPPPGEQPPADEMAVPGLANVRYTDNAISAAELHRVPSATIGEDSAEAVARRVRERREELQARVRQRVNLYAMDEEAMVETAEEAEAAKADNSSALASVLVGL